MTARAIQDTVWTPSTSIGLRVRVGSWKECPSQAANMLLEPLDVLDSWSGARGFSVWPSGTHYFREGYSVVGNYDSESAMYPVLFQHLKSEGYFVMQQVPVGSWRADFITFTLDWGAVRRRVTSGVYEALGKRSLWRLLLAVEQQPGATVADLAVSLHLSPSYVRNLLRQLENAGVVETTSGVPSVRFTPELLFSRLQVVEAKLSDWQRAVTQAYRYSRCATELYVALPEHKAQGLVRQAPVLLQRTGVGVMAVNSGVRVIVESRRFQAAAQVRMDLHILSERLWGTLVRVRRYLDTPRRHERWLPISPEAVPSDLTVGD